MVGGRTPTLSALWCAGVRRPLGIGAGIALAGALALALPGAGGAQAPDPSGLCGPPPAEVVPFAADTAHVGLVDLYFFQADGNPVSFFECVGGRAVALGTATRPADAGNTPLPGAVPWSCTRRVRRFAATVTFPDGRVARGDRTARTPSCAHRLLLGAPARVRAGSSVPLHLVDTWRLGGITTRLCVTAPGGRRHCSTVRLRAAIDTATRRLRADRRGRWRVDLQVAGFHVRRTIAVGVGGAGVAARRPPVVLATGDSTMQGVDVSLADDLGASADVVRDPHPGFGMSRDPGWPGIARAQVRHARPQLVVMSLGAAEGYPIPVGGEAVGCCDADWVAAYAARVRTAMRIYRRGGRARVLYLTVVAQREPGRQLVVDAVNAAIVAAARGLRGVRVLRIDRLITPDGYQPTLRYRGRDIDTREPVGVHLTASGPAIEARAVAKVVRTLLR